MGGDPMQQMRRDRRVAAGLLALGVLAWLAGMSPPVTVAGRTSAAWHLLPTAIGAVALLAQRRFPWIAVGVALAMVAWDGLWGFSIGVFAVLWEALYTATLTVSWAAVRRLRAASVAAMVVGAVVLGVAVHDAAAVANGVLLLFALLLMPIWWAVDVRRQADLARLARRQVEHERATVLRDERSRMSRELHDAVAGDLASVAIHAEAGLRSTSAQDPGHAALVAVRSGALRAMNELSLMISVLRRDAEVDGDDARTAPGLADLDDLFDHLRRSGMRVSAQVRCPDGLGPQVVDHAVYRIVQEALTNARRHGSGQASVHVDGEGDEVVVTVSNSPSGRGSTSVGDHGQGQEQGQGHGLGLLTMRERAEALGGRLEAGWATEHDDGARWRVRASIPLRP